MIFKKGYILVTYISYDGKHRLRIFQGVVAISDVFYTLHSITIPNLLKNLKFLPLSIIITPPKITSKQVKEEPAYARRRF